MVSISTHINNNEQVTFTSKHYFTRLRGEAWTHNINFNPPPFIELTVLSQESRRLYICVVSILLQSTILIFDLELFRQCSIFILSLNRKRLRHIPTEIYFITWDIHKICVGVNKQVYCIRNLWFSWKTIINRGHQFVGIWKTNQMRVVKR